ncbi:hypothetical protein Hanom_Chr06g00544841 [Helianthus anomalus]
MVKMKTNFVGDRSEFSYTFPTQTNLSFFCHSFCHKTNTLFNTSEFRMKCFAIFVRRKCVGNFGRNNSSFLVVTGLLEESHVSPQCRLVLESLCLGIVKHLLNVRLYIM